MTYAVILLGLAVAFLLLRHHVMGFWGQLPAQYEKGTQDLDIREVLNGKMVCDGIIYGPFGRVVSRFNAVMDASWTGNDGVIDEVFTYDSQNTQTRRWVLAVKDDGTISMTATDVIGQGKGQQQGDAVGFRYTFQLPESAGGHALKARDWLYLTPDGTVMNRSQMRKFGILVLELIAVIRPAPHA